MSRQANLPPRYPFQKKSSVHPVYDSVSPTLHKGIALHPQHYKSLSQRFVKEEQPPWINDLLDDSESISSSILQRRSASDSLTNMRDTSASCGSDGRLKPVSLYGPNSPRGKGKPTFLENDIVSTLSEYVRYKQTQNLDESFSASKVASFELPEDSCGSTGEVMLETKLVKRHPGQRSRIRKLQYIAELERTVDILQQMESDLAARVACLVHQRVSLSVENSKLKQKMVRLQQRELIVDDQNQTLLKEFEMLKVNMSKKGSSNSSLKVTSILENAETNWQMLDMGNLNLH